MIKLTEETVYRWGYPFGKAIEIVSVSIDTGESGYNCWGYRLISELTTGESLHYSIDWITPGAALNAAHKERENLNRKN